MGSLPGACPPGMALLIDLEATVAWGPISFALMAPSSRIDRGHVHLSKTISFWQFFRLTFIYMWSDPYFSVPRRGVDGVNFFHDFLGIPFPRVVFSYLRYGKVFKILAEYNIHTVLDPMPPCRHFVIYPSPLRTPLPLNL